MKLRHCLPEKIIREATMEDPNPQIKPKSVFIAIKRVTTLEEIAMNFRTKGKMNLRRKMNLIMPM